MSKWKLSFLGNASTPEFRIKDEVGVIATLPVATPKTYEEIRRNAVLIETAPELLAELQYLLHNVTMSQYKKEKLIDLINKAQNK